MVYGTKNYGAVASAYGPLTRLMPKVKEGTTIGQHMGEQQRKQKQKEIQSSLLEYTKRMGKIKQARIAISKSREQGRLSAVPKHLKKPKVVLPGLNELENNAIALTNKFISHAQWQSATTTANEMIQRTNEVLPPEGAIKSNIFSNEIQKLSESSPNTFSRYWRVLNDGGRVRHIPVLKTTEGIVYSTVTRPATINKPPEMAERMEEKDGDNKTKVVTVDENGNTVGHMTTQTFRQYHPGILPKPGMKGPYKSKVTLHVSLPQMENEYHLDNDEDVETDSCSITLSNNSRSSSSVPTPKPTVTTEKVDTSNETLLSKEKFEAVIQSETANDTNEIEKNENDNVIDVPRELESGTTKDSDKMNEHVANVSEERNTEEQHENARENPASAQVGSEINNADTNGELCEKAPIKQTHKNVNHYPCPDCPVCSMEEQASANPKKSILKKDDKPLPDITSTNDPASILNAKKKRRGSLQQIRLPGGTVKLGKVTYHRSYKINVPPHRNSLAKGMNPEVTLHDSFEDAVNRTDVFKEAEQTLRFEKNRRENQERRKKFAGGDTKNKLWQSLCRHGRFVKECYTCRAVEEIRQRLKNSHSKSEQQYQWNLLSKHERHLTQGVDVKKVKQSNAALDNATRYRLSALSNAADLADIAAHDTRKPEGRPGGRVVVADKEGGRMNTQGLLPTVQPESDDNHGKDANSPKLDEDSSNKRVRFAEDRIYDPMRGSYRRIGDDKGQVLLPPIKH